VTAAAAATDTKIVLLAKRKDAANSSATVGDPLIGPLLVSALEEFSFALPLAGLCE
jgi:hypothetical protein